MWEAPAELYPVIPVVSEHECSDAQIGALRSIGIGKIGWTGGQASVLLASRSYAEEIMKHERIAIHYKECRLRLMLFVLSAAPDHQWLVNWTWENRHRGDGKEEGPVQLPDDELARRTREHLALMLAG